MLLFNFLLSCPRCHTPTFQNILCCCLTIARRKKQDVLHNISKHPMLLFNKDVKYKYHITGGFQNILCCCLTMRTVYSRTVPKEFQNILCCCLTICEEFCYFRCKISKHPMLLFNRCSFAKNNLTLCISKHPMLLFNDINISTNIGPAPFQNILCCCLTVSGNWLTQAIPISKHPMLLFNNLKPMFYYY